MKHILLVLLFIVILCPLHAKGEELTNIGISPEAEAACLSFAKVERHFIVKGKHGTLRFTERCEVVGIAAKYSLTIQNHTTSNVSVIMTEASTVELINYRPPLKQLLPNGTVRYSFLTDKLALHRGGRFDFSIYGEGERTLYASIKGFELAPNAALGSLF